MRLSTSTARAISSSRLRRIEPSPSMSPFHEKREMKDWITLRQYSGVALMVVGALLLVVCYVAHWQSNAELLTGLALVVVGYFLHIWLQKRAEKY